MELPRNGVFAAIGKNVKDQKIIKIIFAAIVDNTTDIEMRAIVFALVLFSIFAFIIEYKVAYCPYCELISGLPF